jgi:Glycosyltransferase sugar-binding region containing DXD motif
MERGVTIRDQSVPTKNGTLAMKNEIVHGLWIGNRLGPMQVLTIRSFLAHGLNFHLWAYDQTLSPVPEGVILKDANQIILYDEVFRYPANGPIDVQFGKGSYAGFSDIFRYKLLFEHGGWYTDMDVTCLKEPDFADEYVFRDHWLLPAVGNIMRCPPKSALMERSYQLSVKVVDQMNDDWHKPVRVMCRFIEELGLTRFIRNGICNLDDSIEIEQSFTRGNDAFPSSWYFIHWCNAMNGNEYQKGSTYHKLLRQYGCEL